MTRPHARYTGQFRPCFSRLHDDRDLYWVVPFRLPLVLGLVGRRFAGVSTAARYLQDRHGFDAYFLSSELRQVAEERGVPVAHRRYLQDLGDSFRAEHEDAGVLARHTLRRIRADRISSPSSRFPRNVVIAGLKHPKELDVLRRVRTFRVVEIRAEGEDHNGPVRYTRVLANGTLREEYEADRARRAGQQPGADIPRFDELSPDDQRAYYDEIDRQHEAGHPGPAPHVYRGAPAKVIERASDREIVDNGSRYLDDLHAGLDQLLDRLRPRQQIAH